MTSDTLVTLSQFVGRQQGGMMFDGIESDAGRLLAGFIFALHETSSAAKFQALMREWEIDAIQLTALLELAKGDDDNADSTTHEV